MILFKSIVTTNHKDCYLQIKPYTILTPLTSDEWKPYLLNSHNHIMNNAIVLLTKDVLWYSFFLNSFILFYVLILCKGHMSNILSKKSLEVVGKLL
jgi:hypothetical protein